MDPITCLNKKCPELVDMIKWGRIYQVCEKTAIGIRVMIDCPVDNPYPDRSKTKKKHTAQTKESQRFEIKKAQMIKAAKSACYDLEGCQK